MDDSFWAVTLRFLLWLGVVLGIGGALLRILLFPALRKRRVLHGVGPCPTLQLSALPTEHNRELTHVSRSDHRSYRLNLYTLTCTCGRFRTYRGFFPAHDIRRVCRHLRREMEDTGILHAYDELSQRIIRDRVRDRCYYKTTLMGTEMAFGFHPQSDFMRVFTRRKSEEDPPEGPFTGSYDKFVLHLTPEHWIYGEAPPGAPEIIREAARFIGEYTKKRREAIYSRPAPKDPPLD